MVQEFQEHNTSSSSSSTTTRSTTSSNSLKQAIDILSSVISYSHSIKVFAGKWQLLRTKLEELNTSLIAIENCDSNENPLLSSLLTGIIQSSNDCHDLARRCVDLTYSGKLLMQSDLDVTLSKFDLLVKNLSGVCASGILNCHGFAIVVSKPGVGACRDDMRFYVKDLLTRIKVGDFEMRRQGLVSLYEVVVEDERYMRVVVEVGEVVSLLVSFLDSPDSEIQELSAKVVSLVSGFDLYRPVLVGAGVVGNLIKVLECGSELGIEFAAKALCNLTRNSDNAWSVSAHGGVSALLKICGKGDSFNGELISSACGVLSNLTGVEEIKRFMIEEGAVSTFIWLSRSKDETLQINAVEFLQNIASGDESVRQLVVAGGGIRAIVRVLNPSSSLSSSKYRERALRAIEAICFPSLSSINMLMDYGFMDRLLFFLQNGDVSIQELALKVGSKLSVTSEELKKSMGDLGFMSEFVRFLDAKSYEVREMAANALLSLLALPKNQKRFIHDERSIKFLLKLLDKEDTNSGNSKFLISILLSLTSCSSGRKMIVKSGYLKNIEKLAESEVTDAKKLVKKLSTNKFRVMLNGIWHS